MSDTELDVSSLGSVDDGVLVFPPESSGGEEEEEWEDAEEEAEEEGERASAQPSGLPFLVVPETEEDRSEIFFEKMLDFDAS